MADPVIDSGYPKVLVADNDPRLDGWTGASSFVRDRYGEFWVAIAYRYSDFSPYYYRPKLFHINSSFDTVLGQYELDPTSGDLPSSQAGNVLIASLCMTPDGMLHMAGSYRDAAAVERVFYARFDTESKQWDQLPQREDAPTYGDSYDQVSSWTCSIQCVTNGSDEVLVAWDGKGYNTSDATKYSVAARYHYKSGGAWYRTNQAVVENSNPYGSDYPHIQPIRHASYPERVLLILRYRAASASGTTSRVYSLERSGSDITVNYHGECGFSYSNPRYAHLGFVTATDYRTMRVAYHNANDNGPYLHEGGYSCGFNTQGTLSGVSELRGLIQNQQGQVLVIARTGLGDNYVKMSRQDDIESFLQATGWVSISNSGMSANAMRAEGWFPKSPVSGLIHSQPKTGFAFIVAHTGDFYGSGNPAGGKLFFYAVDGLTWETPDPHTATHEYLGDLSLGLPPEGSSLKAHSFEAPAGEVSLALAPETEAHRAYTHSAPASELLLSMTPEALTRKNEGYLYTGDLSLKLAAEGAHHRAYTFPAPDSELPLAVSPEGGKGVAFSGVYVLRNKLLLWKDWVLKNALATSRDVVLRNRLGAEASRDYVLRNSLRSAAYRDVVLRNLLEGPSSGVYKDIVLRNVLQGAPRILSHAVSVLLGGTDITKRVASCRIIQDEDSPTNQVELAVSGLSLLEELRAHHRSGEDALEVSIDTGVWRFLVEEIEPGRVFGRAGINVWGRSKTAKLMDSFYSSPLTKTWDEPVLASAVIQELAAGFTIQNDLEDFVIPARVLQAERAMPMEVIRRIAEAQGGVVRSGPLGELILRPRFPIPPAQIEEAAADHTLYESGDLIQLSDEEVLSEGWNAVKVEGKRGSADEPSILIELDSERNNGRSVFEPGEEAYLRAHPTPLDLAYTHQVTLGTAELLGSFEQEIEEEEIQVTDAVARTRYPILEVLDLQWDGRELSSPQWDQGGREIRFAAAEGCSGSGYLRLRYKTRYDLWKVKADVEGKAVLCLQDEEG